MNMVIPMLLTLLTIEQYIIQEEMDMRVTSTTA